MIWVENVIWWKYVNRDLPERDKNQMRLRVNMCRYGERPRNSLKRPVSHIHLNTNFFVTGHSCARITNPCWFPNTEFSLSRFASISQAFVVVIREEAWLFAGACLMITKLIFRHWINRIYSLRYEQLKMPLYTWKKLLFFSKNTDWSILDFGHLCEQGSIYRE